jgi:hypothetical protein
VRMGELRDAVDESTAALPLQPQDIGLKVYALMLADSIDERNRLAEIADRALRRAEDEYGEEGVELLVELGASPRARAEGKAPKAPLGGGGANPLAAIRGGRAG